MAVGMRKPRSWSCADSLKDARRRASERGRHYGWEEERSAVLTDARNTRMGLGPRYLVP